MLTRTPIKTVDVRTRARWRAWLARHHASMAEIWLVFHKPPGRATLDREASIEEALCFGWVDSLVRRLDDARYAVKFTPRKPDSRWSDVNRRRYASLEQRELLMPAGLANAPAGKRSYTVRQWRPLDAAVPRYIERASRPSRPRGGSSKRLRRRIGARTSAGSTPLSARRRSSAGSAKPSRGSQTARSSD
jgi:hypothetical protein